MKNYLLSIIVLLCSLSEGQVLKLNATVISETSLDADVFVGYDNFDALYYIKSDILYKQNNGIVYQYQNLLLGRLSKVDITNPLKIVLFYAEFNAVILLDNQLNEIKEVLFSNLELPILATAAGLAEQNKIWVFNAVNQQIGFYNLESNVFQNLGNPLEESIVYYQSDLNNFNWIDQKKQWLTCTIYGVVVNHGVVEKVSQIHQLESEKIFYSSGDQLLLKDSKNEIIYKVEIVEKTLKNLYYKDQILSIFTNKKIINYKIVIP